MLVVAAYQAHLLYFRNTVMTMEFLAQTLASKRLPALYVLSLFHMLVIFVGHINSATIPQAVVKSMQQDVYAVKITIFVKVTLNVIKI